MNYKEKYESVILDNNYMEWLASFPLKDSYVSSDLFWHCKSKKCTQKDLENRSKLIYLYDLIKEYYIANYLESDIYNGIEYYRIYYNDSLFSLCDHVFYFDCYASNAGYDTYNYPSFDDIKNYYLQDRSKIKKLRLSLVEEVSYK